MSFVVSCNVAGSQGVAREVSTIYDFVEVFRRSEKLSTTNPGGARGKITKYPLRISLFTYIVSCSHVRLNTHNDSEHSPSE